MQFPEWRQQLARSLHLSRSKREARYFQLATINNENQAKNRTVVFRGFEDNTNNILVVTDKRSEKYTELSENNSAEIAWYFAKTREQYRISVSVVDYHANFQPGDNEKNNDHKQLLSAVWDKFSENAKAPFFNSAPATPFDDATINQSKSSCMDYSTMSENFVVLVFEPIQVDYLDLKTEPHTRLLSTLIRKSNTWIVERVVA